MTDYDVVVIGAGIAGGAVAWRLARTGLRVALLEKGSDVANGATRANSGILHSGIHEEPDSDVYRMCREGLKWYRNWADRLDFPLVNKATVILADSTESLDKISHLQQLHRSNLAPHLLAPAELGIRWPFLTDKIAGALEVVDSAQISPYEACRAIVENAIANGLEFITDCDINGVEKHGNTWQLQTSNGCIKSGIVVIAAGAGSNGLSKKFGLPLSEQKMLSGAYFMMNKAAKPITDAIFFGPPGPETKGVLMQNTVYGNLMLGPDSIDARKLEDDQFNWQRICNLWQECQKLIPELDRKDIIRTFTGERVCVGKGFQLENHLDSHGIVRLDGIKSPGLTAAPAIADKVLQMLGKYLDVNEKAGLIEKRLSPANAATNQPTGQIVCRCEQVFARQIHEAIRRGASNIESLRWQTRAGMGDCQGSFCRPTLIKTLQSELKKETGEICLKNKNSPMFTGDLK